MSAKSKVTGPSVSVYVDGMTGEADVSVSCDLIEHEGDGLRFRNHERDPKTGRLVRCECYVK